MNPRQEIRELAIVVIIAVPSVFVLFWGVIKLLIWIHPGGAGVLQD